MAIITGLAGHISKGTVGGGGEAAIGMCRQWGIAYNAEQAGIVCSGSNGGAMRVDGNLDWKGSYAAPGYLPAVKPGDTFRFGGAITGSAGTAVGAMGDVICDSVTINWNIESGEPIGHTVNFGGNGALTIGTVTVPANASVPQMYPSKGCKVQKAAVAGVTYTDIAEVRTAALTITRNNPMAHTSTGAGNPSRASGSLDATVQLTCFAAAADGWASFPKPNDVNCLKLFVTDTLFWLVKFIRFNDLSGMDVDLSGGTFVGCTIGGAFSAAEVVSSTPTIGSIIDPASGVWF